MPLQILKYPHKTLTEVAASVEASEINDELRAQIAEMKELMHDHNGMGLAAVQVGIKKRFFIMVDDVNPDTANVITIINPEIIEHEGSVTDEEGCLSFPGVSAKVQRYNKVKIRAIDEFGNDIELEHDGYISRCIQHEIDHLNGITYFDHLGPLKRKMIEKKYKKLMLENSNI